MSWQSGLQEYVAFLKQKYNLTDEQIKEELFTERIPLEAFATDQTPLQTVAHCLASNHSKSAKEIAKLLGRTTTEIEKFLAATANNKTPPKTGTIYIPATVFADRAYSASEHLVAYLEQQGMSIAAIATLLKKAEPTIWTLHYRIAKKGGRP